MSDERIMPPNFKKNLIEKHKARKEEKKAEKKAEEEAKKTKVSLEVLEKEAAEKEENVEENVEESDSAPEHSESDKESDGEEEEEDLMDLPYLYIDYNDIHINIAKKYGYKTILIKKKEGLKSKMMDDIINGKICNLDKYHVIINCWKVLTKSNLNSLSFDCSDYDPRKFSANLEEKYKWGSKPYLKERLTKDERHKFSLFRPDIGKFLKALHHKGVKIFIVCNSHYHFVKAIFDHCRLTNHIEAIITPSKCGMPHGKSDYYDSYKDGRQINKERVFACIERYIGRLSKYRFFHTH